MPDSLRSRCIEAGARAIRQRVLPRGLERLATDDVILQSGKDAEAVLDAFLDCLTENADEWIEAEAQRRRTEALGPSWNRQRADQLGRLLAVLRNPE